MKRDIENRDDLIQLVNLFYELVKADDEISIFFTDTVHVNWEQHLPKMYDFWENTLFATGNYSGNPLLIHKQINDKKLISQAHFTRWLSLFHSTVNSLFEGEKAERIKQRAAGIAFLMQVKISNS